MLINIALDYEERAALRPQYHCSDIIAGVKRMCTSIGPALNRLKQYDPIQNFNSQ